MEGVDRILREALPDEAPPDPPEPPEREDDDGGHVCAQPLVIVFGDGAHSTSGLAGTLLVGWFHLASFVTLTVLGWCLWTSLSTAGLVGLGTALAMGGGMLVGWITDRRLPRRDERKAGRP